MAEDICYNHGLLISPDTMREFLTPYYQQLLTNARSRQMRRLHFGVDTDGDCRPAIPVYCELGLTRMWPFEVASGCDVVEIATQYPDLIMSGGIDKRVLAAGKDAIEAHLQHIIPFMRERGGYIPTCDHSVPNDVSLKDYFYTAGEFANSTTSETGPTALPRARLGPYQKVLSPCACAHGLPE